MRKGLKKPLSVSQDAFKSQKWDEITAGRSFRESDIPALLMLISWHQIADQCMSDIATENGVMVAYTNKLGDEKAMPQIATMKQASAEIRALNKQLGINDEVKQKSDTKKASILSLVVSDREKKASNS